MELVNGAPVPPFQTECLPTGHPQALERAVDWLQQGSVIAFPTDTVYGVGAHALQTESVNRLFAVKNRPASQAIPLLLANVEAMQEVCMDIPPEAWELAKAFWPGGLTLVLRRRAVVPDIVTGGGPTVAVRVPDHALVRDLSQKLGAPVAATSANLHGRPPAVTASEVEAMFSGHIPFILDGGPCPGGVASTVLDLSVRPAVVLRPGPIGVAQLAAVVNLQA